MKSNGLRRTLRVAFIESTTEMGGAQVALYAMLEHFDRRWITPIFVSLGFGKGDFPERVERLRIPVFRLAPGRFRRLSATGRAIRELVRVIRSNQIDIVVSNSGHPLLFARPASLLSHRPCAWWVHGHFAHEAIRGEAIALAQRWLGADAFFANSDSTARSLRADFPCAAINRVQCGTDIHRHAPDPEEGAQARVALGIAPHEVVIGIFGRLQPWKGQDVFLRAAHLLHQRGLKCRFLVVGGSVFGLDIAYADRLHELTGQLGLADHVLFLGQRSDIPALMNACDIVVHATREPEPWGLVVAEAMATGCAVVASAAGGPLEMIQHGVNGFLCPPGDSRQLAGFLESLIQQPQLRREFGSHARTYAEKHFAVEDAAYRFTVELHRAYDAYASRGLE